MDRPWEQELEDYLQSKFRVVIDPDGPKLGLRIVPSFAEDEAKFFLLGLETGLLEVDENGYLRHGFGTAEQEVRMVDLFRLGGFRPELCRGLITRAALAAELVLDRGWLRQQVHLGNTAGPETTPEIAADVEIKSVETRLLVAVFLERTAHQVAKLKRDLEQCGKRGPHAETNCGFPQNHAKFEYCASSKPPFVWAVAAEVEICLQMEYLEDGSIRVNELAGLPPRSIVELRASKLG